MYKRKGDKKGFTLQIRCKRKNKTRKMQQLLQAAWEQNLKVRKLLDRRGSTLIMKLQQRCNGNGSEMRGYTDVANYVSNPLSSHVQYTYRPV